MNGEFAELLKEIKDWSNEVHGQRHHENLKKFELIFEKLDKLPCAERKGLYSSIKNTLGLHWFLIGVILVAILGLAFK